VRKSEKQFFSKTVYETFFDNYQLFADNPYGFVIVRGDPQPPIYKNDRKDWGYKVSQSKFTRLPRTFGFGSILENANRAYPVITKNGKLKLAIYEDELPYRGRDPPVRDRASGFLFDFAIELDDAGNRRHSQLREKIGSINESYGLSLGKSRDTFPRNVYIAQANLENWMIYSPWKFYGVGFNDIPAPLGNEPVKVRGPPMFQQFPYNNLVNTVKKN